MDFTQAKQRIEQLKAVLWENSRKYYVENAPTMSDYEYDQLMHELEDLEAQYPEYRTADSPTQRVGSDLETPDVQNIEAGAGKEFAKYPHKYPMLSLGNTHRRGGGIRGKGYEDTGNSVHLVLRTQVRRHSHLPDLPERQIVPGPHPRRRCGG